MASAVIGALRVNLGLDSAAFETGLDKSGKRLNSFASAATKALAGLGAAIAAAFSVQAIAGFADQWSDLNSRLRNATGSIEGGAAAMDRLQEVARRSYSSITQTTEAFLSQATTLNALGVSTSQQLDLTETLNNALVISATRGQAAESVMRAWSQAMALGELRGDNLNTVIANSDRLAQALADSMGINVNQLREYGAQGRITRGVMLGITGQLAQLRTEAEEMPATIADGFGILRDSIFQMVGRVDQATGASAGFASMLIAVGDAITSATGPLVRIASFLAELTGQLMSMPEVAAPVAASIAAIAAPATLAAIAALARSIGVALVGAVRMVGAAMMANPLGLFVAGIAAALTAIFMFRDQIKQVIGFDIIEVFISAVNWIVGAWVGAFNAVMDTWGLLPNAMGDLAIRAGQFFLDGISTMLGEAVVQINTFITSVNGALSKIGVELPTLGSPMDIVPRWRLHNPYEGAADEAAEAWRQAFESAMATDYVGMLGEAIGALWESSDAAADGITGLGTALDGNGSGGGVAGSAGAAAEAATEAGTAMDALADIGEKVAGKLADTFTDMVVAFIDGGKSMGEMIASLLKDLGKMFLHQGFQALIGGFGGGGIMGAIGGILGFARGGTILPGGAGGIDSQLVMFRKSPNERVDISKPGQSLHAGEMGVGSIAIHNQINVPPGAGPEVGPSIAREITKALDKQLPDAIERYNRNPLRRR